MVFEPDILRGIASQCKSKARQLQSQSEAKRGQMVNTRHKLKTTPV